MISDDNLFSTVNLMVISTSRSLCNRAKIGTWVKCQCTFWILLVICITILTCWIRLNHGIFAAWASQNCIVTVAAGSLHFGSGSTWTRNGLEHTGTRSSRSEKVRNALNMIEQSCPMSEDVRMIWNVLEVASFAGSTMLLTSLAIQIDSRPNQPGWALL